MQLRIIRLKVCLEMLFLTTKHRIQNVVFSDASRENAFVYAISAGGASHEIARECAKGTINGEETHTHTNVIKFELFRMFVWTRH